MSTDHNDEMDRYWLKTLGEAGTILSGASDAQLRVKLFDVLEEFFDLSNCWQEVIRFTAVPNILEYKVYPTDGGRVLRLLTVLDANNVPQATVMGNIGSVQFLYPYSNPQAMTAVVVKTATDPLNCFPPGIPDWLLPVHGRAILAGILGNMMIEPGTSYFNPTMGNFHLRRFRDLVMHARVATMRMNAIGTQAWAYPQQFRTTTQRGGVSTFNVHPSAYPPR